jgi:hypothetical protein
LPVQILIKPSEYYDSVSLMLIARELSRMEGIRDAAIVMAAAPAITQFVGGSPQLAFRSTLEMYEITFSEHENFTIPALNFRGTPLGIDVRKVMETGILPQINTGIAHKDPGVGMVGAGILLAPQKCYTDASEAIRKM